MEGGVEKTDNPNNGGEGIGDVLGGIFGTLLNPATIQTILSILATKYSLSEIKKIKQELYDYMERNKTSEDDRYERLRQAILERDRQNAMEMKRHADILYGSDEEYYKKYYPDREFPIEGYPTGAAANVFDNNISTFSQGEPMDFISAGEGVNPNYSSNGNRELKTNCQSAVAIHYYRMLGYDVEAKIPRTMDEVDVKRILQDNPEKAFINPITGKYPEVQTIKAENEADCIYALNTKIKKGEIYTFMYDQKPSSNQSYEKTPGHVVNVTRTQNNELVFLDPQVNRIYTSETMMQKIKFVYDRFEDRSYPKIFRIDNTMPNFKVMGKISQPKKKV